MQVLALQAYFYEKSVPTQKNQVARKLLIFKELFRAP